MADVKKVEVIRGLSVSDQYLAQKRLSELTVGQVYYIKKNVLEYLGKFFGKTKFRLVFKLTGG